MALYVGGTVLSGGGSSDFVRIGTFGKDSSANTITCTSIFSSTYDSYLLKLQNISSGTSASGNPIASFHPHGSSVTGLACHFGIDPVKQANGWFYSDFGSSNYTNAMNGISNFLLGTGGEYPQTSAKLHMNGEIWVDYKSDNSTHMGVRAEMVTGVNTATEMFRKVNLFGYAKLTGGSAEEMVFTPGQGTLSTDSKVIVYGLKS